MLTWLINRAKRPVRVDEIEPAVFLHIQKTAGTSLVHLAARHYGVENIITHGDYSGRRSESLVNIPFVSGHFGYDYAKSLICTRKSFTFLRDPVERILSLYFFFRSQDPGTFPMYRIAHEHSLIEFLEKGLEDPLVKSRVWNNQTWQLAHGYGNLDGRGLDYFSDQNLLDLACEHLQHFSFVGLAESFDSDAVQVAKVLKWPPADDKIRANATEGRKKSGDLSLEEQALLAELTRLDTVVYEYARTVLKADGEET